MIRSNRNAEKYIQAGLDVGSDKICCAITEVDSKSNIVKLLGIGTSPATGIKKGLSPIETSSSMKWTMPCRKRRQWQI